MTIRAFSSLDEMFAALDADQEVATEVAKTHPVKIEDLRHGDFFASPRPDHGVVVYGEVWEHSEDYPEDNEHIQESRDGGYVYGRCYSPIVPEGEIGSTHITRVGAKITAEEFEAAKANGFR